MSICRGCEFKSGFYCNTCPPRESETYKNMMKKVSNIDFSTWNFANEESQANYPEIGRDIEISDGYIIDTGFFRGGNWCLYNYHNFIYFVAANGEKGHYWRYVL